LLQTDPVAFFLSDDDGSGHPRTASNFADPDHPIAAGAQICIDPEIQTL
jgi:hypothetical protein